MAKNETTLGEFGRFGGRAVYTIVAVHEHEDRIRELWDALDDCDAIAEDAIFGELCDLGALRDAC